MCQSSSNIGYSIIQRSATWERQPKPLQLHYYLLRFQAIKDLFLDSILDLSIFEWGRSQGQNLLVVMLLPIPILHHLPICQEFHPQPVKVVMPAKFPSINAIQPFYNPIGCMPCGMNHKLVPTCENRLPLLFRREPGLLLPIHPPLPPCCRFTYICKRPSCVLFISTYTL